MLLLHYIIPKYSQWTSGSRYSIKTLVRQLRNSYNKDNTFSWHLYLYDGDHCEYSIDIEAGPFSLPLLLVFFYDLCTIFAVWKVVCNIIMIDCAVTRPLTLFMTCSSMVDMLFNGRYCSLSLLSKCEAFLKSHIKIYNNNRKNIFILCVSVYSIFLLPFYLSISFLFLPVNKNITTIRVWHKQVY